MAHLAEDIQEIARCNAQFRADCLAEYGLKGCHASYLREICAAPGISQDKLAQRICINKSNVARQAAALEVDGFITRQVSPTDKRVTELYPTEKTLQLMPKINAVLQYAEDFLVDGLSEDEVAVLRRVLPQVRARAAEALESLDK